MPGPSPKHSSTRARRNTSSTAAVLRVGFVVAPVLPADIDWHPSTLAWWDDVWASPMAPEFDESDRHGLVMLAVVVNDFWLEMKLSARLAAMAEIRLQSQRFGLSPMDRRRLQWEIERTDEAVSKGVERRSRAERKGRPGDPRDTLRAV